MAARKICCNKCGDVKPTPPDDAARGLYERRAYGVLYGSASCDYCGTPLDKGDSAIALTCPHDAPEWESQYMDIAF